MHVYVHVYLRREIKKSTRGQITRQRIPMRVQQWGRLQMVVALHRICRYFVAVDAQFPRVKFDVGKEVNQQQNLKFSCFGTYSTHTHTRTHTHTHTHTRALEIHCNLVAQQQDRGSRLSLQQSKIHGTQHHVVGIPAGVETTRCKLCKKCTQVRDAAAVSLLMTQCPQTGCHGRSFGIARARCHESMNFGIVSTKSHSIFTIFSHNQEGVTTCLQFILHKKTISCFLVLNSNKFEVRRSKQICLEIVTSYRHLYSN